MQCIICISLGWTKFSHFWPSNIKLNYIKLIHSIFVFQSMTPLPYSLHRRPITRHTLIVAKLGLVNLFHGVFSYFEINVKHKYMNMFLFNIKLSFISFQCNHNIASTRRIMAFKWLHEFCFFRIFFFDMYSIRNIKFGIHWLTIWSSTWKTQWKKNTFL